MFDARLRPIIDPPLNATGRILSARGVSANALTLLGLIFGIAAGFAVAYGQFALTLALIALNRLCDGLDGAVARAAEPSDFGGYFDIVADFVFYVSIPLGFGFMAEANLTAAMLLVGSFTLTGVSFLAFAAIAARRGEETDAHGAKSIFYSTGLAEGAETIAVFVVMCLSPDWFVPIALVYAAVCLATACQRTTLAWRSFRV